MLFRKILKKKRLLNKYRRSTAGYRLIMDTLYFIAKNIDYDKALKLMWDICCEEKAYYKLKKS